MTLPDKKATPRLSIVIVSRNTQDYLDNCLDGIEADPDCADYEIIVVDNDSRDGTIQMLRAEHPSATVIENRENRGFAAACNQGIQLSAAPFILLLNPDTFIGPGNLEKALNFVMKNPRAGIAGCKILYPDGSIQPSIRDFPSIRNCFIESFFISHLLMNWRRFGAYHGTSVDYSREQEAKVLLGAFLLIRKSLFDEIGFLDERFFVYSEETDFCLRSVRAGWKNMYTPDAEIIHYEGGSAKQKAAASFIYLHDSQIRYARKHFNAFGSGVFTALLFIGALLRMILWTGASVFRMSEYVRQKRKIYSAVVQWYLGLRRE